jgi:capsular polysaccharide transport system ATP-binding protein
MRARLAFGLSLAIDFDCLLIDEITAVGDHQFRHKCDEALFNHPSQRGWILVSHDLHFVRTHCHRAAVLTAGRLQHCADMDEAQRLYEEAPHAPA